jgi:hypothetical protein
MNNTHIGINFVAINTHAHTHTSTYIQGALPDLFLNELVQKFAHVRALRICDERLLR